MFQLLLSVIFYLKGAPMPRILCLLHHIFHLLNFLAFFSTWMPALRVPLGRQHFSQTTTTDLIDVLTCLQCVLSLHCGSQLPFVSWHESSSKLSIWELIPSKSKLWKIHDLLHNPPLQLPMSAEFFGKDEQPCVTSSTAAAFGYLFFLMDLVSRLLENLLDPPITRRFGFRACFRGICDSSTTKEPSFAHWFLGPG